MVGPFDTHRRALDLRMAREPRPDEPAIPRPPVLGVARRVHADKTAPGADVSLERLLLSRVEDIAGRVEEYDDLVAGQIRVIEPCRIFGAGHRKAMPAPERLDRRDPLRDRIVAVSGGLRENQHVEAGVGTLGQPGAREARSGDEQTGAAGQQASSLLVDSRRYHP